MGKLIIVLAIAVCGSSAFIIESGGLERMQNGNTAHDNQFPYAVSLQRLSLLANATRGHICGGVLISLSHVLTAASCTYEIVNGASVPITPNQYRVFAGSILLNNDASPDRIRSIANITIHPDYVPFPDNVNDIAVITASVAMTYVNKYVYNQLLCTMLYNGIAGVKNVYNTMICAASFDTVSAGCPSDVGNALLCNGYLTGILFHTHNCQVSSFPEIYTRVSNYTTWARAMTGGASSFQPTLGLLALFTVLHVAFTKVVA